MLTLKHHAKLIIAILGTCLQMNLTVSTQVNVVTCKEHGYLEVDETTTTILTTSTIKSDASHTMISVAVFALLIVL